MNLPGVDMSKVIRVEPVMINECCSEPNKQPWLRMFVNWIKRKLK